MEFKLNRLRLVELLHLYRHFEQINSIGKIFEKIYKRSLNENIYVRKVKVS